LPQIKAFVNRRTAISVYQYWQVNKRKVAAQQAYLEMWNNTRSASGSSVDILLVPTMVHPAVPHCRNTPWTGYTKLFNFLDYPALSFPAGKVDKETGAKLEQKYVARNGADDWNKESYNLETMHGHHIGIQIVGRKFDEEKVLGAAQEVKRAISVS
jgi:amidase